MILSCSSKFPNGKQRLACSLKLERRPCWCTSTPRCLENLLALTAKRSSEASAGSQLLGSIFFWTFFSVKEPTLRFQNFHIIARLLTEDIDLVEKLAACPCIALGAQSVEKVRCSVPAEGVVVAVVDPLSVGPKLFKEASKQSVWLMFNEKSVRERKQIVRAGAYSQQMLCNLYSEKPLSLTMPEVERKIYPGFSHGDVIGYISCLGPSKLWRVPRLVVLSFSCLSCQI